MVLAMLLLSGCISENVPDTGSITMNNGTDQRIGWVTDTSGGSIDEVLAGQVEVKPLAAGIELQILSLASVSDPEWCEPDWITHLLVADVGFDPPWENTTVPGAEVDVLVQFGPGHCWGERNASFTYSG